MKNLSLSISALCPSLQWCLVQSAQFTLVTEAGRDFAHHNAPGWLNYWCLLMFFSLHWTHGSSLLCLSQALYANKSSKMSSVVLREREKAREKVFHGTPTLEETKEDISKCQHSLPVSMFAAGNFPSLSQDKWSAQCYSFQECQGRD